MISAISLFSVFKIDLKTLNEISRERDHDVVMTMLTYHAIVTLVNLRGSVANETHEAQ